MKDKLPVVPSLPREERHQSTRSLLAGVVLLLGFGFTASALMDSPGDRPAPARHAAQAAVVDTAAPASQVVVPTELPEVAAAVRDWAWETREPPPSAGTYDPEELWLPR
jgi:hypothetical protein